ncbi:MoaD/ThiS family protein [Dyella acidiphila]|uniref:MoaD/ThiS family protein n=1 Tax=Dyella acidiphila TaxID=2775866 RepID=A0ABR9G6M0_9GAMM|nr:MoaD/ThiS family protein [Dyella acidiphila]MBE1159690.1 MoaD/ThiS family protein [Dyella acidiphila]
MKRRISLFGALREADARGYIEVDVPAHSTIAELREAVQHYAREHAPAISPGLIQRSAFASGDEILHNHRSVPEQGELAILPPVSGG